VLLVGDHGTRFGATASPFFAIGDPDMEFFDLAALKIKCLIK
jgi:hypothetical protein